MPGHLQLQVLAVHVWVLVAEEAALTMLQAPQQPLKMSSLRFSRLPKNSCQRMPHKCMRIKDRPKEMELLTRHTSRTGTLPAVSFTNKPENEKMRDARNEHVSPESQITLQQADSVPNQVTCS